MKGNYISHFNMRFFYTHQTTFDGHVSPDLVFCGGKRDEVRHETAQKSGSAARLAQAYRWVGGKRRVYTKLATRKRRRVEGAHLLMGSCQDALSALAPKSVTRKLRAKRRHTVQNL